MGDQSRGIITYVGDKISFQNGFGAWVNSTYACDYEAGTDTAFDARAWAGRLPE